MSNTIHILVHPEAHNKEGLKKEAHERYPENLKFIVLTHEQIDRFRLATGSDLAAEKFWPSHKIVTLDDHSWQLIGHHFGLNADA